MLSCLILSWNVLTLRTIKQTRQIRTVSCWSLIPTFQTPDDLHAPTLSSQLLPGNTDLTQGGVSPPRGGYERKILNIYSTSNDELTFWDKATGSAAHWQSDVSQMCSENRKQGRHHDVYLQTRWSPVRQREAQTQTGRCNNVALSWRQITDDDVMPRCRSQSSWINLTQRSRGST